MLLKKFFSIILFIALLVVIWYFILPLLTKNKPQLQPEQQTAPMVPVVYPVQKDVVSYYEFTGETESSAEVDIIARVKGYLENIYFQDGSDIKKGDLLFSIEKNAYQAKRDHAYAQLKSSEAELARAEIDFKRFQEAVRDNAVSKQDLTTKKTELDKASSAVMANKALLEEAELNLSYTEITSPIDGRISRRFIDSGNLVGASFETVLAKVVTLSPMYIYFNVSETMLMDKLKNIADVGAREIPFLFAVGDEEGYPHQGILNFMDNRVDPTTGTISMRGTFLNEDKSILPGMFVKVKVPGKIQKEAVLVNETAVCTDLGGKYLLVVNDENIIKHCPIEIGQQVGDMRVVKSGLTAGQKYIITGLQFVYPGMRVTPQLAEKQI